MSNGWGRGWAVIEDVQCDECGIVFTMVIAVGEKGLKCPECGTYEADFEVTGDVEGGEKEPYNDGAWMTGDIGQFPDLPDDLELGAPL